MGAVDLVIQVESPKSVTRGLQRIGRAGHGVGEVSRGRIFPKFRADLLECAVVARRMREGLIETTVVPRNPLDVLAQQVVAIAASAGEEGVAVDELHALFRRTHTYAELERRQLDNVLDMLDGRYPSAEFAELRPRIVWDRVAGTVRARTGARSLAVANAGTIPDRGLFSVNLPDGRRVGELDEEMVYEARAGQTFLLGRHHLAHRADHPRPGGRHPGAGRAGGGAVLARRQRGAAARARRGHRRVRAGGGAARRAEPARPVRPGRAGRLQPARIPARPGGGHRCRAVGQDARRRAIPRRDRRLAALRALAVSAGACTRRGRWRSRRASATRSASRPTRSGRTTASSSTCRMRTSRRERSSSSSTPKRPRTSWWPSSAPARCSARGSARTPRARCSSRAPTPAAARRCGSSASRRSRCWRSRGGTRSSR